MKIKKVDDKPMIIHTKEKTKIHMHENQDAKIKGHNVYTVDHSPVSKGSTTKQTESVNQGKESYRKSTILQNRLRNLNPIYQYRQKRKDSNRSVKIKNSTIKNAGLISASTTVNQLEGGEEIRNSAMIASTIARPVTGSASKGAALFRKKVLEERKAKIKKVEDGKKLGRRKKAMLVGRQ